MLEAIFRAAIEAGSRKTGLFGLRLQRHSFDFFQRKLADLHCGLKNDAERFQAAFGRTLFIHLTRRDKVEQAVSYVKAQQSGLWHAAPDGTELERLSPAAAPRYDAVAIREQVLEMEIYDSAWRKWFEAERINPLPIDYESLSANPVKTLQRVLDALGLDSDAAHEVEIGVAKLADQTNRRWVARFRSETCSP